MEHVEYEVEDAVGVITLNRPEAANAQSFKVLDELDHAWRTADEDPGVRRGSRSRRSWRPTSTPSAR